ncbi:conserved hypothetical protein [Ricinus communis]|uniref:Uncharacterized protein n=1 Tax=Ricinus communis TaxID=3988 RepID=B9REN9_RICCO|nr:conserved hypothetical protein [Ricinus communis]
MWLSCNRKVGLLVDLRALWTFELYNRKVRMIRGWIWFLIMGTALKEGNTLEDVVNNPYTPKNTCSVDTNEGSTEVGLEADLEGDLEVDLKGDVEVLVAGLSEEEDALPE